jgi:hypothetical protein
MPSALLDGGHSAAELRQLGTELAREGHSCLSAIDWKAAGVPIQELAETVGSLRKAGYPPVFILMYDQAWLLCARLFDSLGAVMEREVRLDTSLFAWSLLRPPHNEAMPAEPLIGNNFGEPHRDSRYAECHDPEGNATALSVWIPLVPVTSDSGCMMVIPVPNDPFFEKSTHPLHMKPSQTMQSSCARPLPVDAGQALLWKPNLIHWGAPCKPSCEQPRISIAMEFSVVDGLGSSATIRRSDLSDGLSMAKRVRLIAQSLLTYEHWHPSFAGISPDVVQECLGSMSFPEVNTVWR